MSRSITSTSFAVLAGLLAGGAATAAPAVVDSPLVSTATRDRVAADAPLRALGTTEALPKAREGAWLRFLGRRGAWNGLWDSTTGAPVRLWGQGIAAPGAIASDDKAAAAATALLAEHLDLLAPGARVDDFELVTNQVHGGRLGLPMRTVAFIQRRAGAEVMGASIGFLFKNDRVIVINSTAIDAHAVDVPAAPIAPGSASIKARAWIETATGVATTVASVDPTVRVLPMVHADGTAVARAVVSLDVVTADGAGRWRVFVDAADGTLVARDSLVRYATGAVRYRVADRSPQRPRIDVLVPFTAFRIAGAASPSDATGQLTWAGGAAASVTTALTGDFARISNAAGALASATLTVEPGGVAVWDRTSVATDDAQLTTYAAVLKVKDYVRTQIAPEQTYVDQQLSATVNENDTCNAFSTGDDIHFFRASTRCENTGRIADVVYHEFGHSLHHNSIIRGVGGWNGGLSEGVSDYLAATITNDAGMGRGFFFNDNALRNLDPSRDRRWPDDASGEVHTDGEIIGGTLWDVRKEMIATYGAAEGVARTDAIFYAIIQRASDIPTTYVEALAQDDDDGDLANGTPNLCALRRVFGAHGLALGAGPVGSGIDLPQVTRDADGSTRIAITVGGAVGGCPAPEISNPRVTWRLRGGVNPTLVPMTRAGDELSAIIPAAPDGSVLEWSVDVMVDGTRVRYPDNPADPLYQVYIGAVETLYCTDFESDAGWTHGATGGGRDNWERATPSGAGGDPRAAASGTQVLGTALTDGVGSYDPDTTVWARSPVIDTSGYATVRLQYKRWLNVEDGFFDQAKITADNATVWSNFNSNNGDSSTVAHRDREWRFHDVDVSSQAADGSLQLEFSLTADGGLEFGGWTIDDVCVVGLRSPPGACGNNTLDGTEQCDDGNTANGDGCSATCALEQEPGTDDGGCCSTGNGAGGPLVALGLGAAVALFRRRRR